MIYINHSFHNGFFHRVFDGSTAPRMRAQYSHLPHEYDHGILGELPGDTTLFSAVPRDTWGSQRKRPRQVLRKVGLVGPTAHVYEQVCPEALITIIINSLTETFVWGATTVIQSHLSMTSSSSLPFESSVVSVNCFVAL